MLQGSMVSRFVVLLCLLALLGSNGPGIPLGAASPDSGKAALQVSLLRLEPSLSFIPIGGTACVDLRVEEVEGLFGFETVIQFDANRVHVVDANPAPGTQVTIGPFLQPQNLSHWYVINSADNSRGTIRIAITRMSPETGVSGSGVLATICLLGVNRGNSPLTLSDTATLMLDPQVAFLSFDIKSGGALVGPVQRYRIPFISKGF